MKTGELAEARCGAFTYLHFQPWTDAGILHGFTGTALNFRGQFLGGAAAEFFAAMGLRKLFLLRQVHGERLLFDDPAPHWNSEWRGPEGEVLRFEGGADGMVLSRGLEPGSAYGILTADCAPVLLRGGGAQIALVHAGWRGLAAGIVEKAAAALPAPVEGIIGPSASERRYEVGAEVVAQLAGRGVSHPGASGKHYLSVAKTAARTLSLAGGKTLHCSERCTIEESAFHSFRRSGAAMGLNLAFVAAR